MDINTECQALRSVPAFRDVDMAKLKLLAMTSQLINYRAGDTILKQGDKADAVYVLLAGEADIVRETATGPIKLTRLSKGTLIGDTGVLTGHDHQISAVTTSAVTALRIERNTFLELFREVPQLALAIARELGHRIERLHEVLAASQRP
jgi:CRP-like cAMP-binding protein